MKYIVLDNVRSAHNVGAIFRTADAAGVHKIFLCGYTPKPLDRFGREVREIRKTSLGATETVAWEARPDTLEVIRRLQDEGTHVVAVEQAPGARNLLAYTPPERVAYVFGNELDGVTASVREQCDEVIEIPMAGAKESLNVSVSVGIALFVGKANRHHDRAHEAMYTQQ